MARILITGGSSYLGQHLLPLASANHEVHYTYFQNNPGDPPGGIQLDLRNKQQVIDRVQKLKAAVIIHTAGSNRVDDMSQVIVQGTANISQAAALTGARLIHISTDVVFDGRFAPYDETASTAPLHEYGRAKVAAEEHVRKVADHAIIRTSLIYGLHIMDRGTAWMVKALRAGQEVTLFTDQKRNPVWAETLSRACLELAANDYRGILNVAGRQVLSRAEFGQRMLDWWGIEARETLHFGRSDSQRWPQDCTLSIARAEEILTTPLFGVDEVLEQAKIPPDF